MAWEADVYQGDTLVAHFERTAAGSRLVFAGEAPAQPGYLAWRIPYSSEPLESEAANLPPFFLNLLPEGARLRMLLENLRLAADDALGLLLQIGWDTIGDVAVVPHGQPPGRSAAAHIQSLPDTSFWELFRAGTASGQADSSIPGVQEKISASVVSMPVSARNTPAAILKLNPPAYPLLVQNEHFFLHMADDCGLEVNQADLVYDKDGEAGLLVQRFDRVKAKRGGYRKLHQEDACQLLGQVPANKYSVSLQAIGDEVWAAATAPPVEITRLIRLIAFSYLIGNGDLHAKNISLLWQDEVIRLSPAYDLLSTLPYPLERRMALPMLGKDDRLRPRDFVAFGARYDIPEKAVVSLLGELTEQAEPWLDRVAEIGFDAETTDRLRREIAARRKALRP